MTKLSQKEIAEAVTLLSNDGGKPGKNLTDKEFDAVIDGVENGDEESIARNLITVTISLGLNPLTVIDASHKLEVNPTAVVLMVDALHADTRRKAVSEGAEFGLTHADVFELLLDSPEAWDFSLDSILEVRNRRYPPAKASGILSMGVVH